MPILKTPEVLNEPRLSGLTTYEQKKLQTLPELEMEEATDFSGHLGFNPVINYAAVYDLPLNVFNPDDITLTITLREVWAEKEKTLKHIREELKIEIAPGAPCAWGSKTETLVVKGADNILQLADFLRETFEKSTRADGAIYYRPIIHPALLGTIAEDVEKKVAAHTPNNDADHPWRQAFLSYGWHR